MSTITSVAAYPVTGAAATTPPTSGGFIPAIWSARTNAKFYAASVFAAITNTNYAGDIKSMGDKIVINNVPDIAISDYVAGGTLNYQTPPPSTVEMNIDQGQSFAFTLDDVLRTQAIPAMFDSFATDAAQQIAVRIDKAVLRDNFNTGSIANKGSAAGAFSASINLGTDNAPVTLTAANVLQTILGLATVLDEQNIPPDNRWLVIDPNTRTLLMSSNLAQAQFMGDSASIVRNGMVGMIDRFKVYVSNNLPRATAGNSFPTKAAPTGTAQAGALARRAIMAGHTAGIAFATQLTKTETLRNPNSFGDLVRGLQVYGYKTIKPEALALAIVN